MLDRMYKDKKIESFISKTTTEDSTKQSDLTKKKNIKFSDFKEKDLPKEYFSINISMSFLK